MNRTLKIKEVGDFHRKKTRPSIKIEERWVREAGLPEGHYVIITNPRPGQLILTVREDKP